MPLNKSQHIEIPGDKLLEIVKKVYDISHPAGMGFLHYDPAPLTDEEAQKLIDFRANDARFAIDMDYVRGRQCKFYAYRDPDGGPNLFIPARWYDHSDQDLRALLHHIGIEDADARMLAAREANDA